MASFLSSILRTELIVFGFALVVIGLATRGFFSGPEYRDRRKAAWVFAATILLLILLTIATAGEFFPELMDFEGSLIEPAAAWGKETGAHLQQRTGPIRRGAIVLTLLLTLILSVWKREKSLPFLLLFYALTFALIGGNFLNRNQLDWAVAFLGLSCLYGWACGALSRRITLPQPPSGLAGARGCLLLAGIILLAFLLRTYQLGEVSYRFDHYESDYAREALKVLSGRHNANFWTSTVWRGLGHLNYSPIYVYWVAFYFWIFSPTLLILKLVPVTFGVLSVLLTFGIFNNLFGRRLALIAAFLMAVSPLHLNYSRIGLLLCSTQTVSLLIVYLLVRALLRRNLLSYVFLGVAVAFAAYFYSPAKYPVLLSAFLIAAALLFKGRHLPKHLLGIIFLFLTLFAVTVAFNIPIIDNLAPEFADYESVWRRTQTHQHTAEADYIRAVPLIWENLRKLTISFFRFRNFNYDPWPQGNLYFNPLIPVLALLGSAYSLANLKRANYFLLLFFTAAFLVPNLLSRPPVMVRRLMVSWPFIYCLAAIPISQLIKKTGEIFPRPVTFSIAALAAAGCLAIGAYNVHIFFDSDQSAGRWEEERYFDERAAELMDDYLVYLLPINQLSKKTIDFILLEKTVAGGEYHYLRPHQIREPAAMEFPADRPLAFVCARGQVGETDLARLKARLGGGRIDQVRDRFGRLIAYTLLVDRPMGER